ncbi:MAG: aldo/keto reductase, partial [Ilumatobacteraceae bacterium]
NTGAEVAPLAFGAMNFGIATPPDEAAAMLERAIDAGINLVDTADVYRESEQVVGDVLARTGRRDAVLLATKVGLPRGEGEPGRWHRREHIVASCDASLRNLQTDRIDLYQLHRPSAVVPIEETLGVLGELVDAGKVRWIGTSTFAAWMVADALALAREQGLPAVVSEQPPYNLLDRRVENELVPMALQYGLGLLPWSPLAMGVLAGRYADDDIRPSGSRASLRGGIYADRVSQAAVEAGNRFVSVARDAGIDPAQLAINWVMHQPAVTAPIIGPRTVEQLEHLLPVMEMTLDDDVAAACDKICAPGSAVANFHNSAPWMKMKIGG